MPAATKQKRGHTNGSATITGPQAASLLKAEADVARKRGQLERAEQELRNLRDRLHDRVPLSQDPKERSKRIRVAFVSGIKIRIARAKSGDRLSLKAYREAGHEITPEMQEAISAGKPYDRWTVKAVSDDAD